MSTVMFLINDLIKYYAETLLGYINEKPCRDIFQYIHKTRTNVSQLNSYNTVTNIYYRREIFFSI